MKIVNTDSYNGDYPNEKFVTGLPWLSPQSAKTICDAINSTQSADSDRYWKVVDDDYKLQPGFEP